MAKKSLRKVEFGDFQTPEGLARRVTAVVASRGARPKSIVEPTCGRGSFLIAAIKEFPSAKTVVGVEINSQYLRTAHQRVLQLNCPHQVDIRQADFFTFNWAGVLNSLAQPILVVGNPPWVTASELGALQSRNLPTKSNFQKRRGFDAVTGKSNFDIAEWMLIHLLQWLSEKQATVAMLLKTTVARKVLLHAWQEGLPLGDAAMYVFDAKKYFGVAAEACLLVCDLRPGPLVAKCGLYDLPAPRRLKHSIAFRRGMLVADVEAFERHQGLLQDPRAERLYRWRSGVKHDCSKVMELDGAPNGFRNGHGQIVQLEPDYLYPMQKGSTVAGGKKRCPSKYMLVTQRETGQPTDCIQKSAPRTWAYLLKHAERLDRRGSSIYRNRPRFSVFGVGPYTFAPWKVAICGLYKRLRFSILGPRHGKPVVVDDTVYFLSCQSEEEARLVGTLLHSQPAQELLGSFIFWDAKRPITVEILGRLDIAALADELGEKDRLLGVRTRQTERVEAGRPPQRTLF